MAWKIQQRLQEEQQMRSNEFLREYYDAEDNDYANRKIDDVRSNRLTLKHLNKLRKQREINKTEHAVRSDRVQQIYRRPAQ